MAGNGTKTRRGRVARLCAATTILGAAVLVSAAPSSAGSGPSTTSVPFSATGAQQLFGVPEGIHVVHVVAVGGSGETVTSPGSVAGGRGAQVEGDLTVTPGTTLFVNVGGDGDNGNGGFNGGADGGSTQFSFDGGGGGGASDVRTISRTVAGTLDSRLLVAGGGGGAGTNGGSCNGSASATGGPGGNAGNMGSTGGGDATSSRGGGGGAGTASQGGAAGSAGTGATPGIMGSQGSGGHGGASPDNNPGGEGGGGGGGLYGGGGGGGGNNAGNCPVEGGGGGGGGSSLVPPGGSVAIPAGGTAPSITISYSFPGTAFTKAPPKKVKTERRRAEVRFKFASDPEGLAFECSVDGTAYQACESPYVKRFKLGKHSLDARSVDGTTLNADQTPAGTEFKVVKRRR